MLVPSHVSVEANVWATCPQMVQGNQDVGIMLATLWCHWKRLSVLPLLVGVMYLFGHHVTGDLPGHSIECQRFKMDGVYVGVLHEVFWYSPNSTSFV